MTNKDVKKVLKILSADGGKAIIGYCDSVGDVSVFGTEVIKELTRRVKIVENTKKVP